MAAQKLYMLGDPTTLLSLSRAAMSMHMVRASVVRMECEYELDPPLLVDDDLPPDVVGVPKGALHGGEEKTNFVVEYSQWPLLL